MIRPASELQTVSINGQRTPPKHNPGLVAQRMAINPWNRNFSIVSGKKNEDLICAHLPSKIQRSVEYMYQNLNQPLRVHMFNKLLGVSVSHFFFLFKRATGRSPIDFFIRMRIQRASQLLAETSLSVKEVASALGYDDQYYFSRVFKSVMGLPPRDFRLNFVRTPLDRQAVRETGKRSVLERAR